MSDYPTRIKNSYPPNIDKIREVFTLTGCEIFAYDQVIYNPGGGALSDALIAHEKVHFSQQGSDPDGWWARYLVDDEFRLQQELEAHQEEFRVNIRNVKDRNRVTGIQSHIALKLSSPLYGQLISYRKAMQLLR